LLRVYLLLIIVVEQRWLKLTRGDSRSDLGFAAHLPPRRVLTFALVRLR